MIVVVLPLTFGLSVDMSRIVAETLIRWSTSQVALFLLRIDMPNDIVRQSYHLISSSFGHLGEPFCFGLVLE